MMLRLKGPEFSDDTYSLIDNAGPPGLVFCVTWFSYQNTGPLGLTYHILYISLKFMTISLMLKLFMFRPGGPVFW